MNPVIVQCPNCPTKMQVDPRFLTSQTNCPSCRRPLIPSNNVAPPVKSESPPMPNFDFVEDESPRSRRVVDRGADAASVLRVFVWSIALGLILISLATGAAFAGEYKAEHRVHAFYAWIMLSLPPAIMIYIVASCIDGICRK